MNEELRGEGATEPYPGAPQARSREFRSESRRLKRIPGNIHYIPSREIEKLRRREYTFRLSLGSIMQMTEVRF